MPRRKSDGAGGRAEGSNEEVHPPAEPLATPPGDAAQLPPAGAESTGVPSAGETPFEGGVVAGSETGTAETVDIAASGTEETFKPVEDHETRVPAEDYEARPSGEYDDTDLPPDLNGPAEPASPESEPPILDGLTGSTRDDAPDAVPPARTAGDEAHEPTPAEAARREAYESAPAAPAPAHHAHEDEEDGGTSVAAWVLGILVLLLAGAGLGIWAAPKVAPHLPSGMKPVAEWLEPGASAAQAELASLRSELEGLEAKVSAAPSSEDLDGRIGAAVAPIGTQVDELRTSIAQLDAGDTRQQLEALSGELRNQAAQLDELKQNVTGQVSGDVNVFKADVEGMRAEIAGLRDQVASQAADLETATTAAESRVEAAEQQVAETKEQATAALDAAEAGAQEALIRAAVASGAPYAEPVTALESRGMSVPPELAAGAQSGILTLASLRSSFPDAAHAAIQASVIASAGEGVLARANAFVMAQVASRSLTPQPGSGTDAVLSRMEDKLRQDDLAGALSEAQALPSEAAAAMGDWLAAAKLRLGATDGLASLASSLPTTN